MAVLLPLAWLFARRLSRPMHHNVQVDSRAEPVLVEGDELQLNRLFQNLIDNALNFGGIAQIELWRQDGGVVVTVDDNGPGINPDKIDETFRPFKRGDRSRNRQTGGVGLGLSITRAIAHRHGGEILVSNRLAGGLRVAVYIPVALQGTP